MKAIPVKYHSAGNHFGKPWVAFANAIRKRAVTAAAGAVCLIAFSIIWVHAQVSPPDLPAVSLSSVPLMAATQGDKPTMALALSVEYPTVGAQYMPPGTDPSNPTLIDTSYSNATEYIGYYDANSCYTYNDAPTEAAPAGLVLQDLKRFDRTGAATNRTCGDAFSGNFLNWASGSAVDIMRMALSGGDRYVDTATLTILQRALLPDDTQSPLPCFFNSRNFPAKRLLRSGGSAGAYFGAIPKSLRTKAGVNDVWVGNILNRIYFGAFSSTPPTQTCSAASLYTLGAAVPAPAPTDNGMGPAVVQPPGTPLPPANYPASTGITEAQCTSGTSGCPVPWNATSQQIYEVWYGSGTSWSVMTIKQWFNCDPQRFGDPGGNGSYACYLRIPAKKDAAWPPPGVPGLNSEGYFFARVRVCDKNADGTLADDRDYGLCSKYASGGYKPTGAIQKYSDKVRLAAFGYLMDQTQPEVDSNSSFGGALRAPMKYVGAKAFDENGAEVAGTNPAHEWDLDTGVFVPNPDSNAMGVSGVINYLNRFGRTNASAQGRYKIFDPVAELHYEVIRYLQGKQPSSLAINRFLSDPTKADGFPVYTTWTDPYGGSRSNTADYSCLKSSVVVVGDINTNDPSNTRFNFSSVDGPANDIETPNVTAWNGWRGVALTYEALNQSMSYVDGNGATRMVARTPTASDPINTSARYSPLIGTAYWARTHDIRPAKWSNSSKRRPGLRVRSLFFDVNEWGASSGDKNTGFRRGQNQFFTAAKYGGFETDAVLGNTWGNPYKRNNGDDDENVWQRPDAPGEAKTFYLAEDARKVLKAFDDIFKTASTAARSIAGSAISSKEITKAGSYAYQGAFNTEDWSGDVLAMKVTVDASGNAQVASTPTWQAAAKLNAMANAVADRHIFVGPVGTTPSAPFTWPLIDPALQSSLSKASPSAAPDTFGPDRLAYLRGDRSKEGTVFRSRSGLLGDIVNSGITYLGAPSSGLMMDPGYSAFYQLRATRTPAVFVGANDGMLHAFNANTGDELFAYIPSWLASKLSSLADPAYVKQAYVDATPAVGEASVNGAWASVLVSGSGGGGRGVFALDVTDATKFTNDNFLWEFTQADDPDLGYVLGRPQIVKMRVSAPSSAPKYKWFAMVESGVNNYVPDSSGTYSSTGRPALFLLSLDKKKDEPWCSPSSVHPCSSSSANYYKISLPYTEKMATGLINARAIFGVDRQVTAVYAGDLQGNVWKFDFSSHGVDEWSIDVLSAFKSSGTAVPLFIARAPDGTRQSITMAPSIASGPVSAGAQTAYVAFGTGIYLQPSDVPAGKKDSFYVVYDSGTNATDSTSPASAISGRGRLAAATASTSSVSVPSFAWGMPMRDDDLTQRAGYFFDFPESGERQISNAVISGDTLVFGSLKPNGTSSQPCGPGNGGNQYALNLDTGNGDVRASNVGLLGEPLVIDLVEQVSYKKSNTTGRREETVVSEVVQQGSQGMSPTTQLKSTVIAGRLNWRSVSNYDEVRRAP